MGVSVYSHREAYNKWRQSKPWWYPLARDPYAPEFVPYWFREASRILMPAVDPLPVCPIKTWEPDPRSQPSSVPTDGARNATPAQRHGLGNGITDMMERVREAADIKPFYGAPIPGAGTLRGYLQADGVGVTGPCRLRHHMTASEARALASWLMKMSAEEPT